MLKWLKKKAGDRCKDKIRKNLKIFIDLSNEVDDLLISNNKVADEETRIKINTIQKKILLDLHLAMISGVTVDEIVSEIIRPFVQDNYCSEGAILGINHILSYKSSTL